MQLKQQIKAVAASLGGLAGFLLGGFLAPYLPFSAAEIEGMAVEPFTAVFAAAGAYLATFFAPKNAEPGA